MASDSAISETVSVILVISLIVVLFIITAALLFGNLSFQQKAALVMAEVGNDTVNSIDIFTIFHKAGDDVTLNASFPSSHLLAIYIDNATGSNRAQPVYGLNTVKPGTTVYIYYNATKRYQVTTDPGTILSNEAEDIPDCPASVRLVDETAKLTLGTWDWECTPKPLTGPPPTVASTTITYGYRGWPITRTIIGTNFLTGASAMLNLTTGVPPEIASTSCTVVNATMMNCTFTLPTSASAPASQRYNVVVINPDGKKGMRANYFYVYSGAPTITSSTPATGLQGATVAITNLRGTYFQTGATVQYKMGTYVIPLTGVTVWNATTITGTLSIPDDAPVGYYNITVTNVDNRNVTRSNAFRVLSSAPTVTGITNRTGYRGWTVVESITGTNFVNGATATFDAAGLATIPADACTWASSTRMNCTFTLVDLDATATNQYNITVINPGGKKGWRANYFTLSSPAPTIAGSTPATGTAGDTVTITNLRGNYFQPGAIVTYWRGPPAAPLTSITMDAVQVPARTQITGSILIPAGASIGYYNITVLNTDGKTVTLRNGFRVYAVPPPSISGIAPGTGGRLPATVPVVVSGSNIVSGARIRLYNGTTAVYLAPVGTVTATQITTTFSVPATVVPGTMNVRITNPDGQYATLSGAFVLT